MVVGVRSLVFLRFVVLLIDLYSYSSFPRLNPKLFSATFSAADDEV
jgi:hypothetical protein